RVPVPAVTGDAGADVVRVADELLALGGVGPGGPVLLVLDLGRGVVRVHVRNLPTNPSDLTIEQVFDRMGSWKAGAMRNGRSRTRGSPSSSPRWTASRPMSTPRPMSSSPSSGG